MEEVVDYYSLNTFNIINNKRALNDFTITKEDKKILRSLAHKKAEIADNPIHHKKMEMWKSLNDLKVVRPLIWINEIPWHEMNIDNELTLMTSTEFSKYLETRLRRSIYLWKHMPSDFIVEPILPCYLVINNTGFGISEEVEIAKTDDKSDIVSREFIPQIQDEEDIEKIGIPGVDFDSKSTEEKYQAMYDIFNGILKVEKRGVPGFWFAPWDELIRWWGVQQALMDLVLRPELVHKVMNKLTAAYLAMLDQFEEKNLLALNNGNYRIGSGGLGYTDQLPQENYNSNKIKTQDLWGCGAAQIFSSVSPDMHYKFALDYEIKWMKRFGLNYYGCCEPLDKKIDILKKIPNLRKISMSPWIDLELGAKNIGKDFVFSYKPSPSIFADSRWDPGEIEKKLNRDLNILKGCNVEIIMKDISTVNYKPQKLWQWAEIAVKTAKKFL